MRGSRSRGLTAVFFAALLGWSLTVATAAADEWHSEQPIASEIGVSEPLGEVGDVEFQAPNRGVLITAGNGGMPAGVYAYDGSGWYLYSTVCGGHQGRIAWAGPTEFWTISDQQVGQEVTGSGEISRTWRISLCHFKEGAVVASYGRPLGEATSYLPMFATVCSGPNDCWFAGERLPGTLNVGAFHLHWDGTALTPIPSLTGEEPELGDPGRAVGGLALWDGNVYESVEVRKGDEAPEESAAQPVLLHRIDPGLPQPFVPVSGEPVVFGGAGASAEQLEAMHLAPDEEGLWAVAGAAGAPAQPIVLRLDEEGLRQIPLSDPGGVLSTGAGIQGIAPEDGTASAWASLGHGSESLKNLPTAPARIARIHADGTVDPPVVLPASGEEIDNKGEAGPVACPAAGQCWMATRRGWLFHLGPALPQDTAPAMHTLITFRPPDESLPTPPPFELPEDDSGSEVSEEEAPPVEGGFETAKPPRKLVVKLHQQIVHGTVLELSFVLLAKAHVRLLAKYKGHTVAKTPRLTLGKGPHRLRLRLDPKRWPTKLDFEAHAVKGGGKR
jgi:hypothetical protein